ncbi:ABC transporter substrate-binding protein [Halopiger djelfimassiliensis]|uniref:ABC transporter substrate-binding protein n=1 Tax=Halopiger djelfimassiliensis TaxID=1293047 RepID=UPI000677DC5F
MKHGVTVVSGGVLAGCLDSESAGPPSDTSTDDRYSVTMAPVGEVEFDSVPEDVFTILPHHADMALALGRGDALNALHAPEYYQSLWRKFTHHLDGVSVDWEGLYSSWPPAKEKLYELDSDVHLADPAKVATAQGMDADDIEEIERTVGPWFGNTFSAIHQQPPAEWADEYEYYTLWEIFENVAAVFREEKRYEALKTVHSSVLAIIDENLPPKSERPTAAMVLFSSSDDRMWGYKMNHPGYYAAHTRPLGATDALADAGYGDSENIELDYEMLLEADPDVLLVLGPMSETHAIEAIRERLESNSVTREISAVKNGRVYTQGARGQGPLANHFQLEMTAKQLYPDRFGEWPGYEDGSPYPGIPEGERLFDRQRVADIVAPDPGNY